MKAYIFKGSVSKKKLNNLIQQKTFYRPQLRPFKIAILLDIQYNLGSGPPQ